MYVQIYSVFDSEPLRPPEPAQRSAPYLSSEPQSWINMVGGGEKSPKMKITKWNLEEAGVKPTAGEEDCWESQWIRGWKEGAPGLEVGRLRPGAGGMRRRCRKILLQPGTHGLLTVWFRYSAIGSWVFVSCLWACGGFHPFHRLSELCCVTSCGCSRAEEKPADPSPSPMLLLSFTTLCDSPHGGRQTRQERCG